MRDELINGLVRIRNEKEAQAFLGDIRFPAGETPAWTTPRTFWSEVVQLLEDGLLEDGVTITVTRLANRYPGSREIRDLLAKVQAEAADAESEPLPPQLDTQDETHALLLIESDRHAEFLRIVQQLVDEDAELLYTSRSQTAVRIADPGERASEILVQLEAETGHLGSDARITYQRYDFRPYLFPEIVVYGPDGAAYRLTNVPATTPVRDIPFAVLGQYADEAVHDGRGRPIRTVVDLINPDGEARRLNNPDMTLHDADFREGDSLRVSPQATAGMTHWFQQGLETARAQINRFAEAHAEFRILTATPVELPHDYHVELDVPGFAPPEDLKADLLRPVPITLHKINIFLPPGEFPRVPPRVYWVTPIFHPNIVRTLQRESYRGVCLGALSEDAYRPDLDLGELCQMLVNMARYRNYEPREYADDSNTGGYVDKEAAQWARSPGGQEAIVAMGGNPMDESSDLNLSTSTEKPLPLWIAEWEDSDDGS